MFFLQFKLIENINDNNGINIITRCLIDDIEYLFVNVYGPNIEADQALLYNSLLHKISDLELSDNDCIVMGGDFNVSLSKIDTDGGNVTLKYRLISAIENLFEELDLCDIFRTSNPLSKEFTWRRTQPLCQCRIDYIFVTNCWKYRSFSSCNEK